MRDAAGRRESGIERLDSQAAVGSERRLFIQNYSVSAILSAALPRGIILRPSKRC